LSIDEELSKYPVYALPLGFEGKAVQFTQTFEIVTAGSFDL
jgi:hypothetical protein